MFARAERAAISQKGNSLPRGQKEQRSVVSQKALSTPGGRKEEGAGVTSLITVPATTRAREEFPHFAPGSQWARFGYSREANAVKITVAAVSTRKSGPRP